MKFKLPHESLDVAEFDFALLESMTQKKHRLAFECYAEISEEMFSAVPIFRRDAFDASFFHHLSSCTVEEAYSRSKNYLVEEPAIPITVDRGAQAAVGIIRFIQGRGEPPLPSLNAVTAKWFNLPSTAFDDPKIYSDLDSKNKTSACNTHPHNIYLQLLVEHGLIGLSLFLIIIFTTLFKIIKFFSTEIFFLKNSYKLKTQILMKMIFF